MNTVIIIPARLNATRLPRKPLAMIGDAPMIVHVWRRAIEANAGPVYVATDSDEIAAVVTAAGGSPVMTSHNHPSGSDRIFEALSKVDPDASFDAVVNLQGDLPSIEPRLIAACAETLDDGADIATLAVEIDVPSDIIDPNIVKVIGSLLPNGNLRAVYFTRAAAPTGPGAFYHHIGIYAYRRHALETFIRLPPSPLECRERLEQLRALEAGMRIDVAIVDTLPLGVDSTADLEKARAFFSSRPYASTTISG